MGFAYCLLFLLLLALRGCVGDVGGHARGVAGGGGVDLLSFELVLVDEVPVVNVVQLVVELHEEFLEQVAQVGVVGLFVEAQVARVGEVGRELGGEALAEHVYGGGEFLFHDALVLLVLVLGLEVLPGERAAQEVHHDVAQGLQVVAATLLDAQMGVDRGVARGAGEVLVFFLLDVDAIFTVALGQAEVDYVDLVPALADAHEEVIWLYIAMQEVALVHVLDALQHLVRQHEHGLY